MFDPIFNVTLLEFFNFGLIFSAVFTVIAYLITIAHFTKRFIMDEKHYCVSPILFFNDVFFTKNPEKKGYHPRTTNFDDDDNIGLADDVFIGTFGQILLCFFIVVILAVVNWTWLLLSIIGGYFALIHGGRAIVRLKRSLEKHMKDKNAHK